MPIYNRLQAGCYHTADLIFKELFMKSPQNTPPQMAVMSAMRG
jgi:hypothetical protein